VAYSPQRRNVGRSSGVETCVRQATAHDAARVLSLVDSAVRCYLPYGQEDLGGLAARQLVWLAEAPGSLRAVLGIVQKTPTVSEVRALCITNGWRSDSGVQTLLEPVLTDLSAVGVKTVLCIGAAAWLVPPLQRHGFELIDRIVFLETQRFQADTVPLAEHVVRPVRPNDVSTLVELDNLSFADLWRYDLGNFMELLVTRSHSVVAEAAGSVVGYAISDTVDGAGYLIRLAVHPDHRQRGLGSRLLSDCLDHCMSRGVSKVVLNTQESNSASLQLYEGFGFQRFGRRVPVLVREL